MRINSFGKTTELTYNEGFRASQTLDEDEKNGLSLRRQVFFVGTKIML